MPYTVNGAFISFRESTVDLDPSLVKTARSSRDFLVDQIQSLDGKVYGFPKLTGTRYHFGSFARRTKVRPLDDIDLMIVLDASGTEEQVRENNQSWLRMTDKSKPLGSFLDSYNYVNSTKVLNKVRDSLSSIPHYKKAETNRRGEAVVLSLTSYPWVYDVVPAVGIPSVYGNTGSISHYLIPDGKGEWKRTDPRKDSTNMTSANVAHGGYLLHVMRLLKYWNTLTGKPQLPSYYLETVVLNTFKYVGSINSVQEGLKYFFDNGGLYITASCPDPKGLGPALDADLASSTKNAVVTAMRTAATYAGYAVTSESKGQHSDAISWWKRIFGGRFPNYG